MSAPGWTRVQVSVVPLPHGGPACMQSEGDGLHYFTDLDPSFPLRCEIVKTVPFRLLAKSLNLAVK